MDMQRSTYCAEAMAAAEAAGCPPDCQQEFLRAVDLALALLLADGATITAEDIIAGLMTPAQVAKLAGIEPLADVTDAVNVAAAGAYMDTGDVCRINTGTYTGDGTVGQAIAGVGFAPKFVWIWVHPTAEGSTPHMVKLDQTWGDYSFTMIRSVGNNVWDNRINSLDADGFTVDDDGANNHPNTNGVVYDYLALG